MASPTTARACPLCRAYTRVWPRGSEQTYLSSRRSLLDAPWHLFFASMGLVDKQQRNNCNWHSLESTAEEATIPTSITHPGQRDSSKNGMLRQLATISIKVNIIHTSPMHMLPANHHPQPHRALQRNAHLSHQTPQQSEHSAMLHLNRVSMAWTALHAKHSHPGRYACSPDTAPLTQEDTTRTKTCYTSPSYTAQSVRFDLPSDKTYHAHRGQARRHRQHDPQA